MPKVVSTAAGRVAMGLPAEIPQKRKPVAASDFPQILEELGKQAREQSVTTDEAALNKLETRWLEILRARERQGIIQNVRIQTYNLKLAFKTNYRPDFSFIDPDTGRLVFHETKGFMRDDAAVKIKTAARIYLEHDFWLIQQVKGEWSETLIKK